MRAEPATLTPALSQRAMEMATTCFLSLFFGHKALNDYLDQRLRRDALSFALVSEGGYAKII